MSSSSQMMLKDLVEVETAAMLTWAELLAEEGKMATEYGMQVGALYMEWVQHPERYTQVAMDGMHEYIQYLRRMTTLPQAATLRFYNELDRLRHQGAS